jgi:dTDP-4-amino-4,6-dideoxygalactose transaminase
LSVEQDYIPFNRPSLVGKELENIADAILRGQASGDGPYSHRCHNLLQQTLSVPKVLLTTSCTDALEMSAILLRIEPGDEVIVPSFTFVSSVNAFVLRGARPVFADIRADTLNLAEDQIEQLITSKTKCITAVHYAGVGCEMDAISEIAKRYSLFVVEDNAHGLFGKYKGKYLGTLGTLATLSFHETKNFTCGEGGALIVNDEDLIQRAEIIREKGTNRSRFFRGEVDKYTWVDIGSSFLPSDILAAFLYAQLEAREEILEKRRRCWNFYYQHLSDWAQQHNVRLPVVPPHCEQVFHMFHMLLPTPGERDALIAYLKEQRILSVFHYLPLHLSDMGRSFGGRVGDCPVTEDVSRRIVRLPLFNDLGEAQQTRVVDAVLGFYNSKSVSRSASLLNTR